jgi:hypothetical protein
MRAILYSLALSVATDCGKLPNGFGPEEEGNQRDSCVDAMDEIESILSDAGLLIEGTGKP